MSHRLGTSVLLMLALLGMVGSVAQFAIIVHRAVYVLLNLGG